MKPFPKLLHSKNIEFFYSIDGFSLKSSEKYISWCSSIFDLEKKPYEYLGYFFCTDDQILEINQKYLKHDTFTDIITFPIEENPIHGEIYISIERIIENATVFDQSFDKELARVMSHGILHLCGYNDHTSSEKTLIRSLEDKYISLLFS